MKNRLNAGIELGDSLGYMKLYNFLNHTLMKFIQIKILVISGVIYKDMRDVPPEYNLNKYQKYLYKLKEIPLSRLLRIRKSMGSKVWGSELDFINFIYRYYSMEVQSEDVG